MAFTRDELQAYIDDRIDSPTLYSCGTVRELCRALLAEMDKQKYDVWEDAPEWAVLCRVLYYNGNISAYSRDYTRELPKPRAREIAEEAVAGSDMLVMFNGKPLVSVIADAILKREKELEADK